jgi:hypothetical protein
VENEFNGKFFTMLDAPFELKDKPLKSLKNKFNDEFDKNRI